MKLGKREKIVVVSGGVGALILLLITFGFAPALDRMEMLDRLSIQKKIELKEIVQLKEEYLSQKKVIDGINNELSKKSKGFAIFSFLEETANNLGIKGNIISMKPSNAIIGDLYNESSIEIRVVGITLKQLTEYLYKIESTDQVLKIKRLMIKPRIENPKILDVTFKVSTFDLLENKGL
jgi:hypothetical protein